MPVGEREVLKKALEEGVITREEICVCAKRILELILWLE